MVTIERKKLEQVLEALEYRGGSTWLKHGIAVEAIKEALAQPAPPPECKTEAEQTAYAFGWWKALESVKAEQPEQDVDWKEMYEQEKRLRKMWVAKYERDIRPDEIVVPVAQPAPVQEPVAWMRPSEEGYDSAFRDHSTVMACTGNPWTGWVPLYTTPQQPAQEVDRHTLQVKGTHPSPCARHCEAVAFNIVIRNLKAQLTQPAQEPNNFCPRCGKRLQGVLGQPQVHTCTPPLWGHT